MHGGWTDRRTDCRKNGQPTVGRDDGQQTREAFNRSDKRTVVGRSVGQAHERTVGRTCVTGGRTVGRTDGRWVGWRDRSVGRVSPADGQTDGTMDCGGRSVGRAIGRSGFWCGRLCQVFSSEVVSVLSVYRSVQRGVFDVQVSWSLGVSGTKKRLKTGREAVWRSSAPEEGRRQE